MKEKLVENANYEKAKTNLSAAKEMVHLAEQSAITVRKRVNNLIKKLIKLSLLEFTRPRRVGYSFTRNDFACDESS